MVLFESDRQGWTQPLSALQDFFHWALRWKIELRQQGSLRDQLQISLHNEKYVLNFFMDFTPVAFRNSFNNIKTQGLPLYF